jgi:hypothetical protein
LLYYVYVSEEIFEKKADWTIAVGCSGSRTGLRGQANRCTLGQFLDHLWEKSPLMDSQNQPVVDSSGNPVYDKQPDPSKIKWPAYAADNEGSIKFDPKQGMSAINSASTVEYLLNADGSRVTTKGNKDATKRVKLPPLGYTGHINPGNAMTGQTDYYHMMNNVGPTYDRSRAEFSRIKDMKGSDNKPILSNSALKQFPKVGQLTEDAAQALVELRQEDGGRFLLEPKKGLASVLGIKIIPETQKSQSSYVDDYKVPSKDATCLTKEAHDKFGSVDNARAAYDSAMTQMDVNDGGKHAAALRACTNTHVSIKSTNAKFSC